LYEIFIASHVITICFCSSRTGIGKEIWQTH